MSARAALAGLAVAVLTSVAACGSGAGPHETTVATTAPAPTHAAGSPCRGQDAPSVYEHVVLVVLENHSFSQIAGASPYLNSLAAACGLAANYTQVGSPSLPNYLALTSGSTWGIASDCTDCPVPARSIFEQLGGDWRSYLEGLPAPGFTGDSSGKYAKKHDPAAYYTRIRAGFASRAVPLDRLATDLAAGTLPRFSLVVPDLCDDEHDCSVDTGDRWLATWVPPILGSSAYARGDTALFVTYDEGAGGDDRVYTVVAGRSVGPGTVSRTPFDHYSLLATIEQLLGLPCLAHACDAATMGRAFHLLSP
jgi:phosphatidylinositol-3-phosphatase